MTTPTRWDTYRRRRRGDRRDTMPTCSRCGEIRVLDPCRDCATTAEQIELGYPPLPDGTYSYPQEGDREGTE